jgi:hypothetical protein
MPARRFTVSRELQAYLAGMGSRSVRNAIYYFNTDSSTPELPSNPETIRLSLVYDRIDSGQYNAYISNTDGTGEEVVTDPR